MTHSGHVKRRGCGNIPPSRPPNPGPTFREEDRALFLEICGVRLLSRCVRTEAQTESLRPCPTMQTLVRAMVPYVQRFLCHQEELVHIYHELLDADIGQKIQKLQYRQVSSTQGLTWFSLSHVTLCYPSSPVNTCALC